MTSADPYSAGGALISLAKAAAHSVTYSLAGRLVYSAGNLLLTVPAALIRGAFDALDEPGAQLPNVFGIPVMLPDELDRVGGADKITERGHTFRFSLGPVHEYEPYSLYSKVYYIAVQSPELKTLRQSYGLEPHPKGASTFQLQVAVRKKGVLANNDLAKESEYMEDLDTEEFDLAAIKAAAQEPKTEKHRNTIYLVRHGRTKLNVGAAEGKDKIRGWKDIPLDEEGKKEAEELAKWFKGKPVHIVYSSNLSRTEHTAHKIAEVAKTIVHPDISFRPWHLGVMEGQEAAKVHPDLVNYAKNHPDKKIPEGESFNEFASRFIPSLMRTMRNVEFGAIDDMVITSHFRNLKLAEAWVATGCKYENGKPEFDLDVFFKNDLPTGIIVELHLTGNDWSYHRIEAD